MYPRKPGMAAEATLETRMMTTSVRETNSKLLKTRSLQADRNILHPSSKGLALWDTKATATR